MRQFTATVYILHNDKVLLHPHPKHGKWLPPGGHLEPNETPSEAAAREVLEETGLAIEWIDESPLSFSHSNCKSLPRPFLCLLEEILARKDEPAHQHVDFIYLAKLKEDADPTKIFLPFQWFNLDSLDTIELFPDVRETLAYLKRRITNGAGAFPLSAPSAPPLASLDRHRT